MRQDITTNDFIFANLKIEKFWSSKLYKLHRLFQEFIEQNFSLPTDKWQFQVTRFKKLKNALKSKFVPTSFWDFYNSAESSWKNIETQQSFNIICVSKSQQQFRRIESRSAEMKNRVAES